MRYPEPNQYPQPKHTTNQHPKDRWAFMLCGQCGSVVMGCDEAKPWNYYCPICDERFAPDGSSWLVELHADDRRVEGLEII